MHDVFVGHLERCRRCAVLAPSRWAVSPIGIGTPERLAYASARSDAATDGIRGVVAARHDLVGK